MRVAPFFSQELTQSFVFQHFSEYCLGLGTSWIKHSLNRNESCRSVSIDFRFVRDQIRAASYFFVMHLSYKSISNVHDVRDRTVSLVLELHPINLDTHCNERQYPLNCIPFHMDVLYHRNCAFESVQGIRCAHYQLIF